MKKLRVNKIRILSAVILVAAVLLTGYFLRTRLDDLWFDLSRAPTPAPSAYEDFSGVGAPPTNYESAASDSVAAPLPPRAPAPQPAPAPTSAPQPPTVASAPVAPSPASDTPNELSAPSPTNTPYSGAPTQPSSIPAQINLAVPFTSQAPFANWDEEHEEACEEASVLMVHAFYEGQKSGLMDPATADAEILKLIDFEINELFGYFKDTTAGETGLLAQKFYGHQYYLIENPTITQIQSELAKGHPVIAPMAGQTLENPYFTPPGPVYHMIVIKGYTKDGFITNDPGTRRGADWVYSFDKIMESIHDWDPENIENGRKVVLVFY